VAVGKIQMTSVTPDLTVVCISSRWFAIRSAAANRAICRFSY
jgi:hypothetical protein